MDPAFILIIVGAILPPIIDLVNKYVLSEKWRFVIALMFSVVVGGIISVLEHGFTNVAADVGLVFAASQAVYKLWYEKSSLQTKIRG